ncbi:hypothetical protein l11_00410 [Neisseria weaveri LMG 5135]|nr:hypothetical protein l13_05870 [Neisseria weaveri ATCC 51223]EGV38962.1 hypothetical protein l11_00410 [Neisseria weaveri LMG 5135]
MFRGSAAVSDKRRKGNRIRIINIDKSVVFQADGFEIAGVKTGLSGKSCYYADTF